jgi:Zn-dependent protease
MHDPFASLSAPLGRLFGITVRIHWLFPFVALGWILYMALYKPTKDYKAPDGIWLDACILILLLFLSVLLHELGHCFAARWSGGDAQEILLWPLGGLATVELPNRPSAHLITAASGPGVNILLFALCVLGLFLVEKEPLQPIWNPLPNSSLVRDHPNTKEGETDCKVTLATWGGSTVKLSPYAPAVWLVRAAWINYFLALLNLVLVGFPLDGGRILQSALWPSLGYRQATLIAVFAGFAMVFVVGLYAIIMNEFLAGGLSVFIFLACYRQWMILEHGGEEGVFGYDFSQGYTSLERDQIQAAPPQPKVNWWRRWLQKRAARKLQREQERKEAEERRLDELLDKVHREGRQALTDEEQRFMKRISDRYRRK